MSVYLSVSTLEDEDIADTVRWAVSRAENPSKLTIGIAATVREEFYWSVLRDLMSYPQVKIDLCDPLLERGIGNGRNNALHAYDGQDYVLQVDSHTHFVSGWDDFVGALHDNAVRETGNEKTVVTGYCSAYYKSGDDVRILSPIPRYSVFEDNHIEEDIFIKEWKLWPIRKMYGIVEDRNKTFYPANKMGADLLIANQHWVENTGLPRTALFWEEEIVQAINLLESGFSLAFPNVWAPITHRYHGDNEVLTRARSSDLYDDRDDLVRRMNASMADFIRNNFDACKRYAGYSGYDLTADTLSGIIIPRSYSYPV